MPAFWQPTFSARGTATIYWPKKNQLNRSFAVTALRSFRCVVFTLKLSKLTDGMNLVAAVGTDPALLRCECKWPKAWKRIYAAVNAAETTLHEMRSCGSAPRNVSVIRVFLVTRNLKTRLLGCNRRGLSKADTTQTVQKCARVPKLHPFLGPMHFTAVSLQPITAQADAKQSNRRVFRTFHECEWSQ